MADRRRIAVYTTGRQDYGVLRSTLLLLRDDPRFELRVWAGGMHLSPKFGHTIDAIEADGLRVAVRLDFIAPPPQPGSAPEHTSAVLGPAGSMAAESARALELVTRAIETERPEALVLLGDRYETLAAGFAAALAGLPIAHLHGGEETEGALDNALRHALTKLSHLHLVSHAQHARRVRQMGEPAETVVVVGAPGLDNLYRDDLPDRGSLERSLGIALDGPSVVVTLHPATLGGDPAAEVAAVAQAMESVPGSYVITQPNADRGAEAIRAFWSRWAPGRSRVAVVDALGEKRYWGLLRIADAVLGNSSSGILEAPAAGLPVVNVGDRQRGRLRSAHVRDVPAEPGAIAAALRDALLPETRARLAQLSGPYPSGPAAPRIVEALAAWRPPRPARKRFADLPLPESAT